MEGSPMNGWNLICTGKLSRHLQACLLPHLWDFWFLMITYDLYCSEKKNVNNWSG